MDDAVYDVVETFKDKLGVVSFNLAAYGLPLRPVPESWYGFPVIARIVDRGPVMNQSCEIAMELYATSVVSSDP